MTAHATWLYAYVYDTHVCRILHIHTCVHMLVHTCKGQKKTPCIILYHPLPCFLKIGYHTEPQAGMGVSKPSKPPVSYLNNWRGFKAYKCPCVLGSKLKSCIASALTHGAINPVPNFSSTLFNLKKRKSQAWWCMTIIPGLEKYRQENGVQGQPQWLNEFKVIQLHETLSQKKKIQKQDIDIDMCVYIYIYINDSCGLEMHVCMYGKQLPLAIF